MQFNSLKLGVAYQENASYFVVFYEKHKTYAMCFEVRGDLYSSIQKVFPENRSVNNLKAMKKKDALDFIFKE